MSKRKHKCNFTALHATHGSANHAHQCLVCDDVTLIGDGKNCDGKPATHRRSDAQDVTP